MSGRLFCPSYFSVQETGLYYLQSRYYDPAKGRFINADSYASTGQGILGNNMVSYCNNNPVIFLDPLGQAIRPCTVFINDGGSGRTMVSVCVRQENDILNDIAEDIHNFDINNTNEETVLNSNFFSIYNGIVVIRTNGNRSGSFGIIFLTRETNNRRFPEDMLRHEYGHTVQFSQMNPIIYLGCIMLPSWQQWGTGEYYSKPWEITADIYGIVESRNHSQQNIQKGFEYLNWVKLIDSLLFP